MAFNWWINAKLCFLEFSELKCGFWWTDINCIAYIALQLGFWNCGVFRIWIYRQACSYWRVHNLNVHIFILNVHTFISKGFPVHYYIISRLRLCNDFFSASLLWCKWLWRLEAVSLWSRRKRKCEQGMLLGRWWLRYMLHGEEWPNRVRGCKIHLHQRLFWGTEGGPPGCDYWTGSCTVHHGYCAGELNNCI